MLDLIKPKLTPDILVPLLEMFSYPTYFGTEFSMSEIKNTFLNRRLFKIQNKHKEQVKESSLFFPHRCLIHCSVG